MLRLDLDRSPRWIDLLDGAVRMKVAPVTSAIMLAVRSDLARSGLPVGDVDGWHAALVKAIARRTVEDWEGFGDEDGNAIPPSAEAIDAAMDLHKVFAGFDASVVAPYLAIQAEKKSSATLPDGTSETAPTTAGTATGSATNAPDN